MKQLTSVNPLRALTTVDYDWWPPPLLFSVVSDFRKRGPLESDHMAGHLWWLVIAYGGGGEVLDSVVKDINLLFSFLQGNLLENIPYRAFYHISDSFQTM